MVKHVVGLHIGAAVPEVAPLLRYGTIQLCKMQYAMSLKTADP